MICWLEPGCWPSQSPWGRLCPEVIGKARSVPGDHGWVWRNSSLQRGWCYPLISHRWFSQSFLCCLVTLLLKPLPRSRTLGLSYSMDMMSFLPACHPRLFWHSLPRGVLSHLNCLGGKDLPWVAHPSWHVAPECGISSSSCFLPCPGPASTENKTSVSKHLAPAYPH